VKELKVAEIRRPLARTRANNAAKVEALMESILEHGLKQPIDVLEVTGHYECC
jgi:sulfiredoxin